jgi:hypothetical protein
MPLMRTTKDEGHYHIVYMSPVDGGLVVADAAGHVHPMGEDGMIGEAEGHTHAPEPYEANAKPKGGTDAEVRDEAKAVLDEIKDLEKDARISGREAYDFYYGKQWDPADKQSMVLKNRPAVTINEVRSKVNVLLGYQVANRTDIIYRPMESGDEVIAEIYTRAAKAILERCGYPFQESRAMADALIAGRGVLQVYMDYDDSIEGDIRVEWMPWDQVFYGPHDDMDLRDCDVEARVRWLGLKQAKVMFPEHADEIQESYDREMDDDKPSIRRTGRQYDVPQADQGFKMIDTVAKRVRFVELWRKEYERANVAVHAIDDYFARLEGWAAKDIAAVRRMPGFAVLPQNNYRVRVTRLVGDAVVSDEYPDMATPDFHTIPIYCYKTGCGYQGLVEDMKDLQKLENKVFSQHADILNKIAATGWFVDAQTFADKKEETNFKKNASSPGFVVKVRNTGHVPVQVQPPQIPQATIQALDVAAQKMREVTNINLDLQGFQSDAMSGVAIVEKKRQGLIGNSFVFDNLSLAKKKLGRMLVRMLCKHYTPERLYKLLMGENSRNPMQVPGPEGQQVGLDAIPPDQIMAALEMADPTKFDVTVDESPFNTTIRRANFLQWAQMASNGVPVPPGVLVEMSDLPNKAAVVQMMDQFQQQQAEGERMKYDTEIKKAMIAAGSRAGASAGNPAAEGMVPGSPMPM